MEAKRSRKLADPMALCVKEFLHATMISVCRCRNIYPNYMYIHEVMAHLFLPYEYKFTSFVRIAP